MWHVKGVYYSTPLMIHMYIFDQLLIDNFILLLHNLGYVTCDIVMYILDYCMIVVMIIVQLYSLFSLIEVEVSDMSAVETVLRADTKRLALLEEEKQLLEEGEKGDDSRSERLQAVYEELEAIGAASAESRARRILSVSSKYENTSNEVQ